MSEVRTHSSFEEAREQAAAELGFVACERITLRNGEVFEIPNPSLLDDDQQPRLNALDKEMKTWDRVDDERDENGALIKRGTGAYVLPHCKDNELVEPYNTQLAKALFGDRYEAFKAAGGRGNDVNLIWTRMQQDLRERQAADPKSAGSAQPVAAVPEADSGGAEQVPPAADWGVATA